MEWRPGGFLAWMGAKAWVAVISRVPVGYADGTGFHDGKPVVLVEC